MRRLVVLAALLASPPAAVAQEAPLTPAERSRVAAEAPSIGRGHALEHVLAARAVRSSRRGDRATSAQAAFDPCKPHQPAVSVDTESPRPPDGPTGQARCGKLPRQPSGNARARLGRWSPTVADLPHYAIHATVVPTGKVLFWGYEWTRNLVTKFEQQIGGRAGLHDPATGRTKLVPPPQIDVNGDGDPEAVPIYCSGQSLLPDGRVLVTGGYLEALFGQNGFTYPPGHRLVLIFDPRTEKWSRGPDLSEGRWYPTQTKLGDGRTLVMGGFDDRKPNDLSTQLDVISADGRTRTTAAGAARRVSLYPGMTLMPDGQVLLAGPFAKDSALLDPKTMTWRELPDLPSYRGGGSLVALPTRTGSSPRALLLGGTDASGYFDGRTQAPALDLALVYDHGRTPRKWRRAPSPRNARHYPNAVLLPDGSMVLLGGSSGITPSEGNYTPARANRRVELWNPRTGRWSLGPAQREDRTYHSVGVLLPDGRVWSAGDDANPNRDGDTAELYEPPYLFKGARPSITAAPKRVAPRSTFTVTVRGRADRVTLLAPSATTHSLDMGQRFVELDVVRAVRRGATTRLTVRGPRSRDAAPPGPWMLFALSPRGAVSKAAWVSV